MSVDNIQGTTNGASLLPRTAPKRKAPKKHGKSNGQQKTPWWEFLQDMHGKKNYIYTDTDFNFLKNDIESGSFIFVISHKSAE